MIFCAINLSYFARPANGAFFVFLLPMAVLGPGLMDMIAMVINRAADTGEESKRGVYFPVRSFDAADHRQIEPAPGRIALSGHHRCPFFKKPPALPRIDAFYANKPIPITSTL